MKSLSRYTAKILCLVCLVIAGVSVSFGLKLATKIAAAQQSIKSAQLDDSQSTVALAKLKAVLTGHETAPVLDRAVEETVFTLQHAKLENRITVSTLTTGTVSKNSGRTTLQPVSVGGTNLLSVSINLRGAYADYAGLTDYLATVRKLPVSLTRLKIEGTTFELSLTVFGIAK